MPVREFWLVRRSLEHRLHRFKNKRVYGQHSYEHQDGAYLMRRSLYQALVNDSREFVRRTGTQWSPSEYRGYTLLKQEDLTRSVA